MLSIRQDLMPSLIKKLTSFARSPQGNAAMEKAREQVAKPENRRRLEELRARVTRRRSRHLRKSEPRQIRTAHEGAPMWDKIKNALASVKETTGIEIPGMPEGLGSIGESATTTVQDLTESATGAVDGVAAATETVTGGIAGAGETAATAAESAGEAAPDLFDKLFGANPLK